MRVVLDIEANGKKPTQIWSIVCKDIDTGELYVFKTPTQEISEKERFLSFASKVETWIGHNILGYDLPNLSNLLGLVWTVSSCIDTYIVSKLINYSHPKGHSLECYGEELEYPKNKFSDFTKWSQELEDRCVTDVNISELVYNRYLPSLNSGIWDTALKTEQAFQLVCNNLHSNGFSFNSRVAEGLLQTVTDELAKLDREILDAFPDRLSLVREIHPRLTRYGTLNKSDFRWIEGGDLSEFNGGPFSRCIWKRFNPASHRQIVEVLSQARWEPIDKTKVHIDTEREINRLKYSKKDTRELDIEELSVKLEGLRKTGWKVNENNLSTLPPSAPTPAKFLARRILYEARRRTLVEQLGLVAEDGRIHGRFQGIGAWTHRMAHQEPNMANIPNEFDNATGKKKLLGKELRSLWRAPRKRLLVGVDAEGIQFRIFAHYVNDKELIQRIVDGRKADKTDPHSYNQRLLAPTAKTRQAAKQTIFSTFLGAGIGKYCQILDCERKDAEKAYDTILTRYPGIDYLRKELFPIDAKRGYFIGLDGRRVPIPGDTLGDRKHLAPSGYLQNGEAIIMKMATLKWEGRLYKEYGSWLVNLVHDEWQTETPNDMEIAVAVAKLQADSLREVGVELNLNCPLAGSFYNEDHKDYTIGTNWYQTH